MAYIGDLVIATKKDKYYSKCCNLCIYIIYILYFTRIRPSNSFLFIARTESQKAFYTHQDAFFTFILQILKIMIDFSIVQPTKSGRYRMFREIILCVI